MLDGTVCNGKALHLNYVEVATLHVYSKTIWLCLPRGIKPINIKYYKCNVSIGCAPIGLLSVSKQLTSNEKINTAFALQYCANLKVLGAVLRSYIQLQLVSYCLVQSIQVTVLVSAIILQVRSWLGLYHVQLNTMNLSLDNSPYTCRQLLEKLKWRLWQFPGSYFPVKKKNTCFNQSDCTVAC